MATAEQLKALLKSHLSHDEDKFRSVVIQIAAHQSNKGNLQLAEDLKRLIDTVPRTQSPVTVGQPRAVPMGRTIGELAGLISISYPSIRLSDMVLSDDVRTSIEEVVRLYRQRDLLQSHGLSAKRKLLLVGPPGCGKTMTASALAFECQLPLMYVQLHGLISKYMGETATKLHVIFESMEQTRGVYLFDEFDAIGTSRSAKNDIGEVRRILNSFLQFLERDSSESIVVSATNYIGMLDEALFRRFDQVIEYSRPNKNDIQHLIQNRLSSFDLSDVTWKKLTSTAVNLSHAEVAKACDDAAREAVLKHERKICVKDLLRALVSNKREKHRN